jgi:hypothetical protein
MRSILTIGAIISIASFVVASSGAAQEYTGNAALGAYREYRLSVAAYEKCLADNQKNENACQEQRHIMDTNAQVWSTYPESQQQFYYGVPLGTRPR